uniref:ABC transporter domain-containing protein n=1 Tax=Proboscia inermis TaxID=420281 RepID=A0A7S0CHP6_9STRA|mmetsp:Transcript_4868/g.5033  ORF Transcript_4868/g.5033 Transcript_4868/m.5033 type:complete len:291 (+) Transcript_4868:77-949(+)
MDILCGQTIATSGTVYVEGREVRPSQISQIVSLCGQIDTIWPEMKVLTAIRIFLLCRGYNTRTSTTSKTVTDPYVAYLVRELGMEEMLLKKVKALSGGQKRRLAFLVSLIGNTRVVLVDEAMTGVDIQTRQMMWKILRNEISKRNRSVVVTTHDVSEVEQYCNTVGILHRGQLVEMGELRDIRKKWSDSIKLICLCANPAAVDTFREDVLLQKYADGNSGGVLEVQSCLIDVLSGSGLGKVVATFTLNLGDVTNIIHLIRTMKDNVDRNVISYWSVEPLSLDDFIRASSV